jgi:NAD+ synthase
MDPEREAGRIEGFIRKAVEGSGAEGAVVGLSGGVDSAVTAALAVRALGRARVAVMVMPSGSTPKADVDDSKRMAEGWGVRVVEADVDPIVEAVLRAARGRPGRVPRANVQARARMTLLYLLANSRNLLVLGTGDRSEHLLGYFTKYGDGGADAFPILHLYKTEVRRLAEYIGVPARVARKRSSPRLWRGQKAEDELPGPYEVLDPVLECLFDEGMGDEAASRATGATLSVVAKVRDMYASSSHKRALPPSLPREDRRGRRLS